VLAWLAGLQYLGSFNGRNGFVLFVCLVPTLHAILKVAIASEAAGRFVEARRRGELELLLVTPLSSRNISRGHLKARRRQFLMPVLLVVLIDGLLMVLGDTFLEQHFGGPLGLWLFIWAMLVMLLIDARALAWV